LTFSFHSDKFNLLLGQPPAEFFLSGEQQDAKLFSSPNSDFALHGDGIAFSNHPAVFA
jgi:hypothetical protein